MKPFEYFAPTSIDEACNLLQQYGADGEILAGGTDVLVELRKPGAACPQALIDISRIQALKGIEESGDFIILRPLTTHADIARSEVIRRHAALLSAAASTIGSPLIRNRGTVGGNIMNAAACADTVPPLLALGAEITLRSSRGERTIAVADLFVKPYVTVAQRDEILTAIRFQKLFARAKGSFIKLGRRNALSIARLSVAAIMQKNGAGTISLARIVTGAAFPTWQRTADAEAHLIGKRPSAELFAEAGMLVSKAMISNTGRRWSTEYKEPVVAVLVRRALEACNS